MAIINGRRIQVPPSGITGQHLIQQLNPGPGRRPVIQQGAAFRPVQAGYTYLRIKKDFIHQSLVEMTSRYDVDTIADVHTHPFVQGSISFSATDDGDEQTFFQFLKERFEGLHYASIVFSQRKYSARVWTLRGNSIVARKALLKAQTSPENISSSDFYEYADEPYEKKAFTEREGFFHRSTLALGLDVMRKIMRGQVISIVGVGGLGSVIAEHLIHMGFHGINLIDPDLLEMSNLNRVVGAYYEDAQQKRSKVDVVKRHLTNINPKATVLAYKKDVHEKEIESVLALSDWIIVATDNHSSRRRVQELSFQYFVPFISVGVNITVNDDKIEDMSGEVITTRVGDYLCLNCL
ncbi:MAG TPA: ThiF family adenylyltransferase, partial [Ktedonobacteraceae bacterium]|nr:ThiF family adenylyltransferase [Ktedonobacteraceae bacterium]